METLTSWILGLLFSLFIGHAITSRFLKLIRQGIEKPTGRQEVPAWVTGATERLVFTVLVGLHPDGTPAAMMGWLALKLATNWNHPDWMRIPTQIDTHSVCKSAPIPMEIGTCSDANRHPYLG
jgi:hypothetical protein